MRLVQLHCRCATVAVDTPISGDGGENRGRVIGGIVGGVVGLLLLHAIIVLIVIICRRRREYISLAQLSLPDVSQKERNS